MKKFLFCLTMLCMVGMLASCSKESNQKTGNEPIVSQPPKEEAAYVPVHLETNIDLKTAKTYNYFAAPSKVPATAVNVDYGKKPYAQPTVITYSYANGDTHVFTIPADFGIWKNEAGKLRVVVDADNTVWIQGQVKKGHLKEFVFYGDPQHNGQKIKPNSYVGPSGQIKYRK